MSRLIDRDDPRFEEVVFGRVFNGRRPGRRPAAVLEAATEADVVAGVGLARERGWPVAIRAGGHSWAAWSVRDDALLIDLGGLRQLELDGDLVHASPSITGGELNTWLNKRGLMFRGGHCPTVGIGGFLLQGGMGWNCRGLGWACEQIEAIDVVTADGELVRADAEQNADLFWAARGSGPGFFGVVTRFHLRARPLPGALTQSTAVYPMDCYDEIMGWLHATHASISEIVELVAVGITPPGFDEPMLVVHGVAFADEPDEADAALAPLEKCPVAERAAMRQVAQPTTFADEYAEQRRANPEGHRYTVDNAWLDSDDKAVEAMRRSFTELPTAKSFSLWFSMAPLRALPDMALSLQSEVYFATYVVHEDASDDARIADWVNARMAELEPVAHGVYLGDSDFQRRPARFMDHAHLERLEGVRARWDPDNRFLSYLGR